MACSKSGSDSMDLPKMAVIGATKRLCAAGFALCLSGIALAAQDKSPSPTAAPVQNVPIPTLHAYESLLQVPVLVLRPNGDRIKKPISDAQFSVSLDSGSWFPATHVRAEGDDPIALSILLDVSGDGRLLMPKMAAIAGLAPKSLGPQDHVSVYALDCSLIRGANDVPADSSALKQAVDEALSSWTQRNSKKHDHGAVDSDCKQPEHLLDALAKLTEGLQKLPGRRVILVVSDGEDHGSTHTWSTVKEAAQGAGVAIFGLKYTPDRAAANSNDTENRYGPNGQYGLTDATPVTMTSPAKELDPENSLRKLCELTGGTARLASPKTAEAQLKGFTAMVRERYIVEFPRPLNGTPGWHALAVRVDQGDYFIRSAGIKFPLMNPALQADPTTVHSDPSRAPSLGSRPPQPAPQ
jgi:VWFA-related protein